MPFIYVARSQTLQEWGAEVGLTKHIYKLGVAEGTADEAIAALNAAQHAGQTDWKAVKKQKAGAADEGALVARFAQKERMVDPNLYPKLRGATGIFKVRMEAVANYLLVKDALAGGFAKFDKLKPADIGTYMISSAIE